MLYLHDPPVDRLDGVFTNPTTTTYESSDRSLAQRIKQRLDQRTTRRVPRATPAREDSAGRHRGWYRCAGDHRKGRGPTGVQTTVVGADRRCTDGADAAPGTDTSWERGRDVGLGEVDAVLLLNLISTCATQRRRWVDSRSGCSPRGTDSREDAEHGRLRMPGSSAARSCGWLSLGQASGPVRSGIRYGQVRRGADSVSTRCN